MVKYKDLFEEINIQAIDSLLHEYFDIAGSYTIDENTGLIDVIGNCKLKRNKKIKQLPVKFSKVSGNFWCHYNQLTSLEGSPISVGRSFCCDY